MVLAIVSNHKIIERKFQFPGREDIIQYINQNVNEGKRVTVRKILLYTQIIAGKEYDEYVKKFKEESLERCIRRFLSYNNYSYKTSLCSTLSTKELTIKKFHFQRYFYQHYGNYNRSLILNADESGIFYEERFTKSWFLKNSNRVKESKHKAGRFTIKKKLTQSVIFIP